ncbi:hypothetical protein D3C85_1292010 [compost metagenome]
MGTRQDDLGKIRVGAVEGKVVAVFVAGHQVDHTLCAIRRQVQLQVTVLIVVYVPTIAQAADGRHGVEQTDQVDLYVLAEAPSETLRQWCLRCRQGFCQYGRTTLTQIIDEMTGCRCASAKTKNIDLQ